MVADRIGQGAAHPPRATPRACGPAQQVRRAGLWLTMAAAALIVACWEGSEPEGMEPSGIVSNPVFSTEATGSVARSAGSPDQATNVAWVSLRSDSIPGGQLATIQNERTGGAVTAPMLDGGFDPVAIEALAGDTLRVEIQLAASDIPVDLAAVVPKLARPRVVRTWPPTRKRDVVLNARLLVVFTEPIDRATLTTGTIQLRRRIGSLALPVSGRVEVSDAEGLTASFRPDQQLAAEANYVLTLSPDIRDQEGEHLAQSVSVQFATGSEVGTEVGLTGQIAFVSDRDGGSIPDSKSKIYVMDAGGSAVRRLTSWPLETQEFAPAWSPDGSAIAFSGGPGANEIWIANSDGSGVPRQLTALDGNNAYPTWSSAGDRIAFEHDGGGHDFGIWVMNADGSSVTALNGSPDSIDLHPAWSPDGAKIAFERFAIPDSSSDFWGLPDIYVMNADGSNVVRLTRSLPDSASGSPAWSPDGKTIAFLRGARTKGPFWVPDIYLMNADGSGVRRLTEGLAGRGLTWSSDGTRLAFASFTSRRQNPAGFEEFFNLDIYVVGVDGNGLTRLTDDLSEDGFPAWSPLVRP